MTASPLVARCCAWTRRCAALMNASSRSSVPRPCRCVLLSVAFWPTIWSRRINLPPHANSAVDGYAVRHTDLSEDRETELPISGRAAAGHPLGRAIRPGEAVRIFTGAPMPDDADTVMMQEDCVAVDGRVRLKPGIRKGANCRQAGEDVALGETALASGVRLSPAEIGLAAALGHRELRVYRPLRVALLSTGDEVREPGTELPPGAIYDANRFMLAGIVGTVRLRGHRFRHRSRP